MQTERKQEHSCLARAAQSLEPQAQSPSAKARFFNAPICISSTGLLACWLLLSGCRTFEQTSARHDAEIQTYDGITEAMDSLPDCNQDTTGSFFWVRTVKTGYECLKDGQWSPRSTEAPDEVEYDPRDLP